MIFEAVAQLISKEMKCPIDNISPETTLAKLGVDSLKAITILYELEEQFNIVIPNEYMEHIVKVSDIVDKVDELSSQPAQS